MTLDDLLGHAALTYRRPNAIIKWHGRDEDGWRELRMSPAFVTNDGASLTALAAALRDRRMVRVEMADPALTVSVSREGESGIYLLFLQPRFRIPKIKVALDFLVERLADADR